MKNNVKVITKNSRNPANVKGSKTIQLNSQSFRNITPIKTISSIKLCINPQKSPTHQVDIHKQISGLQRENHDLSNSIKKTGELLQKTIEKSKHESHNFKCLLNILLPYIENQIDDSLKFQMETIINKRSQDYQDKSIQCQNNDSLSIHPDCKNRKASIRVYDLKGIEEKCNIENIKKTIKLQEETIKELEKKVVEEENENKMIKLFLFDISNKNKSIPSIPFAKSKSKGNVKINNFPLPTFVHSLAHGENINR